MGNTIDGKQQSSSQIWGAKLNDSLERRTLQVTRFAKDYYSQASAMLDRLARKVEDSGMRRYTPLAGLRLLVRDIKLMLKE